MGRLKLVLVLLALGLVPAVQAEIPSDAQSPVTTAAPAATPTTAPAPGPDAGPGGYDSKPKGLTGQAAVEYHHLGEGCDSFPYEWVLHLKSASYKGPDGEPVGLLSLLEKTFGFLPSPDRGTFLSTHIGLPVAWSNSGPDTMDARQADAGVLTRPGDGGAKSSKVVGTTCALCHSGGWTVGGKFYRIEGAPSRVDSMGYFEELARSTINLLAKKPVMTQFMKDMGVANPENEAKEQVAFFFREVGHDSHMVGIDLGQLSGMLTMLLASKNKITRLHKASRALSASLERLYRITYHLSPEDNIGDMTKRFEVLGKLCSGDDPRSVVTNPGPGRFDAFGRLATAVAPEIKSMNFDAPVRYPPCWAMKYTSMVHYNANTNAVLMRNAGEALGLGAVVTNAQWDSSINFQNLDKIEKYFYDIKVPNWNEIFADQPALKAREDLAAKGKAIYEAKCMKCHDSQDRVGPTHKLIADHLYSQAEIGTDPKQATNLNPVGELVNQSLRKMTLGTRGRYYDKHNIPEEQRISWELRDLRGGEFFRWTNNGDSTQQAQYGNNYGDVKPGLMYRARHLSGMWAAAPFLHNGSVPTLWDLLQPSAQRPKYFNTAGYAYDTVRMGIVGSRQGGTHLGYSGTVPCADEKTCFDTTLPGNDNSGHEGEEFGTTLPAADKQALMEYLKVLPPAPEYAW